ncbi:MAG: TolC family protein [Deltaproteobacteria bacterium]|nr:TolC family protein [Deltaproteobacteria bacterium]
MNERPLIPWTALAVAASLGAPLALPAGAARAAAPAPTAPATDNPTAPGEAPVAPSAPVGALTASGAVTAATQHSPSLAAAMLEAKRASILLAAERARYAPTLTASIDYTHNANPSLNSAGVSVGSSDVVSAGAGITQQFAWGTSIAAELSLNRSSSEYVSPQFPEPVSLGPGYGVSLRVSAIQPLLRGLGRDQWEAALRSAEVSAKRAKSASELAGSEIARQVMSAYWELWYAEQSVLIQRAARETAERQLAEARAKVDAGAMAPFAALPLESSLAAIEEQLVAAESSVRTTRVSLGRLVGGDVTGGDLATAAQAPSTADLPVSLEQAIAEAKENAPDLVDLRAAVEQARLQVVVAVEATRPRLDASAFVQVQGLGNDAVDDAFSQFGQFEAVSAGVGLAFELPLDPDLLAETASAARVAVDSAKASLANAEELIAAQAATYYETARAARARVDLAQRTAEIAKRTAEGQLASFQAGASTALEVTTAQQDQREAELRVLRAKVDYEQALLNILHLTGRLLDTLVQ